MCKALTLVLMLTLLPVPRLLREVTALESWRKVIATSLKTDLHVQALLLFIP